MKTLFKHINGNRFEINESVHDYKINKLEEQNAVRFLVKKLMPEVLEEKYNHFLKKYPARYPERKYPRITSKNIAENLVKLRRDIDNVSYESIINDDVDFQFYIKKMDREVFGAGAKMVAPQLVIGAQSSLKPSWTWWDVEYI